MRVTQIADVGCSGTMTGMVKVFNITDGAYLSGFFPQVPGRPKNSRLPVHGFAFHPHKTILYASQQKNSHVSMFTCNEDKYR